MGGLIRQYGFDDLLLGLRCTYIDQVYARAKSDPHVVRRVNIMAEAVRRLGEVNDQPLYNGEDL
jgi:hypothetical protein